MLIAAPRQDGLVYLSAHKIVLLSFVVDIIAMALGMPRALFPQMAHESFGGPIDGWLEFALLYAAMPPGAVIHALFGGWVSRVSRRDLAVRWAIAVWGAAADDSVPGDCRACSSSS